MPCPMTPNYASLRIHALCIVLAGFFAACSGGGSSQPPNNSGTQQPNTGTGGVSFRLVWDQQPRLGAARFAPPFNACVDRAINTISATVSSGTTTVTGNSWPCSLHEGLILGVPAGAGYTVQINGVTSGSLTTWTGTSLPITVTTGQVTDAGAIVMSYAGGDTTAPTVLSIVPRSNPAITTNIPVTDRIVMTFDEPMAISSITTTNISLSANSTPVPGNVRYDEASHTAAFIPSTPLAYNTQYVLNVISCVTGSCISDTAGNHLANNYTNTFTTETAPIGVPGAAPGNVTAAAGNGQVTLDWLASNGAAAYNIYYLASAGVTTTSGTLIAGVQAPYLHLGLNNTPATTYHYIVTAVNSLGESPASAEASATPVFPAGNPPPPGSVTVTPGVGQNQVTWSAVPGATTYNLYWSAGPITPGKDAADHVVRDAVSPFDHTGLTNGLTYCYIVTAISANGESADSMQACGGVGSIQVIW